MKPRNKHSRGRWQVERERCRLRPEDRTMKHREPDRIDKLVPRLMKKLGLEDQHWLIILNNEWKDLVGEDVAKHTRPGRYEDANLSVFVDSSVWFNELTRYGRKTMLSNLQNRFGEKKIRSITLQLDPDGP